MKPKREELCQESYCELIKKDIQYYSGDIFEDKYLQWCRHGNVLFSW